MHPGFVGIATNIDAHRLDRTAGPGVANEEVDVEDEIGNLLHRAGHGDIGAELMRHFDIAIAAILQVLPMRLGFDRRNIDQFVNRRCRQFFAQGMGDQSQPRLFRRLGALFLAFKTGIEQFEIKQSSADFRARRSGGRR